MALTVPLPEGPELKSPADFEDSPLSRAAKQPLMLGLFLNLQDINFSSLPTSNSWTFDYNAELVKRAEELGFEIAFSRTQWLPKGGYDGESSLDSFIALGAMAAVTKSILLISTIHVLYGPLHPLHLAKYGATLDHIAKGRWGINIVTGHRAVEHEMFGWQRIDHDKRYDMAGELFDVLHRLWGETENFSHEGNQQWLDYAKARFRPPAAGDGDRFARRHRFRRTPFRSGFRHLARRRAYRQRAGNASRSCRHYQEPRQGLWQAGEDAHQPDHRQP
jgi:dimethylsulfone monooxygenase